MSIAALNWAWSQECPNASAKLVLLALADKANDDGECWPGMDHIASMVGVSTRQVSTHLGTLVDAGLLDRKRRRTQAGQLGRYVFYLKLTSGSSLPLDQGKRTSGSTVPVEPPATGSPAPPATGSPLQDKEQPPKSNPQKPCGAAKPREPDLIFDALVQACGIDVPALTKSGRGRINKAAKELRDIGASPEGIAARAGIYRRKWPEVELTPTALAANYGSLTGVSARASPEHSSRREPEVGSDEFEARRAAQKAREDAVLGA